MTQQDQQSPGSTTRTAEPPTTEGCEDGCFFCSGPETD